MSSTLDYRGYAGQIGSDPSKRRPIGLTQWRPSIEAIDTYDGVEEALLQCRHSKDR